MARAYDHMKPFPRFKTYVESQIQELKEQMRTLQVEARMWAEPVVQDILSQFPEPDPNHVQNCARGHIRDVTIAINSLETEMALWQRLMDQIEANACIHCAGNGSQSYYGYDDSHTTVTCKPCDGTGVRVKVSA